jgi:type VI secretion system protein ImpE
MDPAVAVLDGRFDEALAAVKDAIRRNPADAANRGALFQIHAFRGDWAAAEPQLKLMGELNPESALFEGVYERAIACERERANLFQGRTSPTFFGEPEEWMAALANAVRLMANGKGDPARDSRDAALAAAPETPCEVDGEAAPWLADADSRLGPIIEAFVEGSYWWVPMQRIRSIVFGKRTHVLDAIWAPVQFEWTNGGTAEGLIPVRYPGSEDHPDSMVKVGRATEWSEPVDGYWVGSGHRVFTTGERDYPLAEMRSIQFQPIPAGDSAALDPTA